MRGESDDRRERTRVPLPGFGPTRVFRAETMRDAFLRVKEQIGSDAVILTTRDLGPTTVPDERFEVVAALPSDTERSYEPGEAHAGPPRPLDTRGERARTLPDALRRRDPGLERARTPEVLSSHDVRDVHDVRDSSNEHRLTHQLSQLEGAIKALESQLALLTEKDRRLREDIQRLGQTKALLEDDERTAGLVTRGLEREVALEIVERAMRRATPRNGLAVARPPDIEVELARAITTTAPLWSLERGAVCALIGPAGAGKTTTLLKLAGLTRFAHKRSVGLITTDVARFGQLEILESYAAVMGLEVIGAHDRAEVERALDHFADHDLVLIDTVGHNPFDQHARHAALKPVSSREVTQHLVVPATMSPRLARELVTAYDGPALGSLIGTFLDAVQAPSALIAACLSSELPVSHISSGREIPDDLEAADVPALTSTLTRRAS